MSTDSRIPVLFVEPADIEAILRPDDAVLAEDGMTVPAGRWVSRFKMGATAHAIGCTCCVVRPAPSQTLAALFVARARGEVPFFRRVVAVVRDRTLVERWLEDDVTVRSRFCITAAPTVTGI